MSTAPSYSDDIFAALGIPSDPEIHEECGILLVDPNDHGEDYPFKVQVRRIGHAEPEELEGSVSDLPDLADYGLELIISRRSCSPDRLLLLEPTRRGSSASDPGSSPAVARLSGPSSRSPVSSSGASLGPSAAGRSVGSTPPPRSAAATARTGTSRPATRSTPR